MLADGGRFCARGPWGRAGGQGHLWAWTALRHSGPYSASRLHPSQAELLQRPPQAGPSAERQEEVGGQGGEGAGAV